MATGSFKERGRKLLDSANSYVHEIYSAYERKDWNAVMRHSQEVVELLIKGAICLTGNEFKHGHGDTSVKQLQKLLATTLKYEITDTSTTPALIYCHFADDTSSGFGVMIFQNKIRMGRIWNHAMSPEDEESFLDSGKPFLVYHRENNGGVMYLSREDVIIAAFNELGGQLLISDNMKLAIELTTETWDLLRQASKYLEEHRCPAFYHEAEYTEHDARQAWKHMKFVYTGVKNLLGGPVFPSDPKLP